MPTNLSLNLTQQEYDGLTDVERKQYDQIQRQTVFGHDVKVHKGKPIEQGIGAPGHETNNHFAAIRLAEQRGEELEGTAARLMAEAKARRKG